MDRFVAALDQVNVDILYSGMPRIPEAGEEVFSRGFGVQLGGGAPATMIALARLGVPSRLGTFLGDGLFSRFARAEIERSGVDCRNFYAGELEPLTVTSVISMAHDRSFVSYRPPEGTCALTDEQVHEHYRGAALAYVSLGHANVWRALKREGATLLLDTGWRDDLGLPLFLDHFPSVDFFTPNDKEAMKITGAATPEAALRVLGEYLATPLVKLGAGGCLIAEGGAVYRVPAVRRYAAQFRDATGAGDAFLAGFLYALYRGRGAVEAALCGNIAGGKSVTGVGCLSSVLTAEEMESVFEEEKGNIARL